MAQTINASRLDALQNLMEEHYQTPEDYDEDVEEDVRPYFRNEKPVERFVCVTMHDQKHFFLTLPSRDAAMSRATEYVNDDIFEEIPVAVVDLDDGTVWRPRWSSLQWTTRSS